MPVWILAFVLLLLIASSIIVSALIAKKHLSILNHFNKSYSEIESERVLLIDEIQTSIVTLEEDINLEELLLKVEGRHVKPVFRNMLAAIKSKTKNIYDLDMNTLTAINVELQDLKYNLTKKQTS